MTKRKYRHDLGFVASAFEACWRNALDLVGSSKILLDGGHYPPALSLSVLALEELGKLVSVDGLLFAGAVGHKSEAFAKALKSHSHKLAALELLPMLIGNIASADPRWSHDQKFRKAMGITLVDLKRRGNEVMELTESQGFGELDKLKQQGFYSHLRHNELRSHRQSVDEIGATTVHGFAWRAANLMDFVLTDGGLLRYIGAAKDLRSKFSEEQHIALEEAAADLADVLFGTED